MGRQAFHWPEALTEGALLGGFMVIACVLGVVLDHPGSPATRAVPDALAKRALFGAAMAATAAAITYSRPGRRSGAHLNPAVTLAFLSLGKVRVRDAVPYVAAQATGAIIGVLVAWGLLGNRLAHPAVHFVTTRPGPGGAFVALGAEVLISFVLMSVVLVVSGSRWHAWTGACAAILVALYITFEAPISGMSMNPARSFGSAVAAGEVRVLWIYLVGPPLGMLLAARAMRRHGARGCAKLCHSPDVPCIFCGQGRPPGAARRAA